MIQAEALYKAKALDATFAEVAIPYYARKAGVAHGTDPRMIIQTAKEMIRLFFTLKKETKNIGMIKESSKA